MKIFREHTLDNMTIKKVMLFNVCSFRNKKFEYYPLLLFIWNDVFH